MNRAVKPLLVFVVGVAVFWIGLRILEAKDRPDEPESPELSVDKATFRCPEVLQGQIAESETVTLRNTGEAALTVESIATGCLCLPVEIPTPLTIAPGASHDVRFRVRTESKVGPYQVPVTFRSNAANTPTKEIKIAGTVQAGITASPEEVRMETASVEEARCRFSVDVQFVNEYHGCTVFASGLPVPLSVASQEALPSQNGVRFTFAFDPGLPLVVMDDTIEFTLSAKDVTIFKRIPVRLTYFKQCEVDPFPLNVGAVSAGRARDASTRVRFRADVTNVSVKPVGDEIQKVDLSQDSGGEFLVAVSVGSQKRTSLAGPHVLLSWQDAKGGENSVRIPVIGVFY